MSLHCFIYDATFERNFPRGSLPAHTCRFPLPAVDDDRPSRNFFNNTPKYCALRGWTSFAQEYTCLISSWSARPSAPASLSMLPPGRSLLRPLKTSASRFYCASNSLYSTLSSSHREQVNVACRSNGHITLRQVVVVVNFLTRISLNVFSTSTFGLRNASF